MNPRLAGATLVLALAIGAATGCAPTPEPSEPTPVFTSEADAFAAAEETYRAYVDALNAVDLSDPETFEDVFAWTTGEFNAEERQTLSQMHADSWSVDGVTDVVRVTPLDTPSPFTAVSVGACADVSSVVLIADDGTSQVSPSRPDVQSTRVDLVAADSSPTGYLIADIVGSELDPPCQE